MLSYATALVDFPTLHSSCVTSNRQNTVFSLTYTAHLDCKFWSLAPTLLLHSIKGLLKCKLNTKQGHFKLYVRTDRRMFVWLTLRKSFFRFTLLQTD